MIDSDTLHELFEVMMTNSRNKSENWVNRSSLSLSSLSLPSSLFPLPSPPLSAFPFSLPKKFLLSFFFFKLLQLNDNS